MDKEIQKLLKKYSLRSRFAEFCGFSTSYVLKKIRGKILQKKFMEFMMVHIENINKDIEKIKGE
jgi:hypothetical protein